MLGGLAHQHLGHGVEGEPGVWHGVDLEPAQRRLPARGLHGGEAAVEVSAEAESPAGGDGGGRWQQEAGLGEVEEGDTQQQGDQQAALVAMHQVPNHPH